MAKKETTPKDYDRWGKTCIKFDNAPKNNTTKKVVKKGK